MSKTLLILKAIEMFANESPEIMESLKRIFTKADPTPQEWADERTRISSMNYDDLVPAGRLLNSQGT